MRFLHARKEKSHLLACIVTYLCQEAASIGHAIPRRRIRYRKIWVFQLPVLGDSRITERWVQEPIWRMITMSRSIKFITILFGLALGASMPSMAAQNLGPTLSKIATKGTITIGYRESARPFEIGRASCRERT